MKSYIPKQPKQTRERLEVKLEQSLLQKLERYCQYLDSDREYVLACMLQVVFKKDKGFAEWLESHDQAVATSGIFDQSSRRTAV
jgi:bacterioferritin (cytochrome b1)